MADDPGEIASREIPCCPLCSHEGIVLYHGLRDPLFGAPGRWGFRRCPGPECGLIWLDPCPLEQDIGKAYLQYFTHDEGGAAYESPSRQKLGKALFKPIRRAGLLLQTLLGVGIWSSCYKRVRYGFPKGATGPLTALGAAAFHLFPARRTLTDFRFGHLPPSPGKRLLEVGCGSGEMLERLASLGWDVVGQEVDPGAVAEVQRRGLSVRSGALPSLGIESESFDAIVMNHVLEHVHDPVGLLDECHRILKPGGQLAMVVPNADSMGHRLFHEAWLNLDPPRHIHLFNQVSLKRTISRTRFGIARMFTSVREAHILFHASMDIRTTGFHRWGRPRLFLRHFWTSALMVVEALQKGKGEELVAVLRKGE